MLQRCLRLRAARLSSSQSSASACHRASLQSQFDNHRRHSFATLETKPLGRTAQGSSSSGPDLPPPFPDVENLYERHFVRPSQRDETDVTLVSKSGKASPEEAKAQKDAEKLHPAESDYLHPLARGRCTKVYPNSKFTLPVVANFRMHADLFYNMPPRSEKAQRFLIRWLAGTFIVFSLIWNTRHHKWVADLPSLKQSFKRIREQDSVAREVIFQEIFVRQGILQPVVFEFLRGLSLQFFLGFPQMPTTMVFAMSNLMISLPARLSAGFVHWYPFVVDLAATFAWFRYSNFWCALAVHVAMFLPFQLVMANELILDRMEKINSSRKLVFTSPVAAQKFKEAYDAIEDRLDDHTVTLLLGGQSLTDSPAGIGYECGVCSKPAADPKTFPTKGGVVLHSLVYHEGKDLRQVKNMIDRALEQAAQS